MSGPGATAVASFSGRTEGKCRGDVVACFPATARGRERPASGGRCEPRAGAPGWCSSGPRSPGEQLVETLAVNGETVSSRTAAVCSVLSSEANLRKVSPALKSTDCEHRHRPLHHSQRGSRHPGQHPSLRGEQRHTRCQYRTSACARPPWKPDRTGVRRPSTASPPARTRSRRFGNSASSRRSSPCTPTTGATGTARPCSAPNALSTSHAARWAMDRGMAYTSHHDAPVALPNSIAILSSQVTRVTRTSGSVLGPDQGQDRLPALSHTPKARPRPTKGNVRSLCPPLLTPTGRSPGRGAEHQQTRSTETTCSIHTHRTGSVEVPSRCLPELIWSPQETSPDSTAAETPGLFHPGAVRSCAWGCLGLRMVGARIADPEHGDVSAGATR